jgi:hypothetical protein
MEPETISEVIYEYFFCWSILTFVIVAMLMLMSGRNNDTTNQKKK